VGEIDRTERMIDPALDRLISKIRDVKGLDFSQYKEKSLSRRINTRLTKHGVESYDRYMEILDKNPEEYEALVNAITINVTDFFRNPEMFDALEKIVIPRVIYSKKEHHHRIIKAWSCACSTGDEPYSLAIILKEKLGRASERFILNIVGTDIDKNALEEAKNMIYSKERLEAVNSRLIDEYFEDCGNSRFKLKHSIGSLVSFRRLDVINDLPITHCDIILCRNLFIYFSKELQEKILLKFYDSLSPGGFLILGMVESLVGEAVNYFEVIDNRLRIYRRPEKKSMQCGDSGILSQNEIDKIVNQMLGG